MAKYQIIAVLLTPSGNYDETTDPKAVADFNALESAWDEGNDDEVLINILSNYEIENGAIEEHNSTCEYSIQVDADGYYLLKKISE